MAEQGRRYSTPLLVATAAVVVLLSIASTVIIANASGPWTTVANPARSRHATTPLQSCQAPNLDGTIIAVTLSDMGGSGRRSMMNTNNMMGRSSMMQVSANPSSARPGMISFVVTNVGMTTHELIVVPLDSGQSVGQRSIGADNKVDESKTVGEASSNCGSGAGDGIRPGGTSWVTLTLPAGNYELLCNIAGHYRSGMYTELQLAS